MKSFFSRPHLKQKNIIYSSTQSGAFFNLFANFQGNSSFWIPKKSLNSIKFVVECDQNSKISENVRFFFGRSWIFFKIVKNNKLAVECVSSDYVSKMFSTLIMKFSSQKYLKSSFFAKIRNYTKRFHGKKTFPSFQEACSTKLEVARFANDFCLANKNFFVRCIWFFFRCKMLRKENLSLNM